MVVKDEVASSNLAISSNKRGEKPCVSCLFCFSPVTFDYLSIFAHFREIWQKVDQKVDLEESQPSCAIHVRVPRAYYNSRSLICNSSGGISALDSGEAPRVPPGVLPPGCFILSRTFAVVRVLSHFPAFCCIFFFGCEFILCILGKHKAGRNLQPVFRLVLFCFPVPDKLPIDWHFARAFPCDCVRQARTFRHSRKSV